MTYDYARERWDAEDHADPRVYDEVRLGDRWVEPPDRAALEEDAYLTRLREASRALDA